MYTTSAALSPANHKAVVDCPLKRAQIDQHHMSLSSAKRIKSCSQNPNFALYNYMRYKEKLNILFVPGDEHYGTKAALCPEALKALMASGQREFLGIKVNDRGYVYEDTRCPTTLKLYAVQCANLPGQLTWRGSMKFTEQEWAVTSNRHRISKSLADSNKYALYRNVYGDWSYPVWANTFETMQVAVNIFYARAPDQLRTEYEAYMDGGNVMRWSPNGIKYDKVGLRLYPRDVQKLKPQPGVDNRFLNKDDAVTCIQRIQRGRRWTMGTCNGRACLMRRTRLFNPFHKQWSYGWITDQCATGKRFANKLN